MQVIKTLNTGTAIYKRSMRLMGNHFEISVAGNDAGLAEFHIYSAVEEIGRIEKLITPFSHTSQTNEINRNAGIRPVKVDLEVYNLIDRSKKISDLTLGAFDITYGSAGHGQANLPASVGNLQHTRALNYQNIILDPINTTVFLTQKGMRISFSGIGKGYAAERAKLVMKAHGAESGIVNASGDLTAWGCQPNGKNWTTGSANPHLLNEVFSDMDITDMAMASWYNFEKLIATDGKKYLPTVNYGTGTQVNGIKSITIVTFNAEIADAMISPVTKLGIKAGLNMIDQIKNIEAIIVDDKNRLFKSKNIKLG